MELMVAMVASVALLGGLASVMLIARLVAYTPSAAIRRTQAADVVNQLSDELRHATLVLQQTPGMLEFVVADRTGNGAAERIRYEWSGVAGEPLLKTINAADAVAVLDAVETFAATLLLKSETAALATTTQSGEGILVGNTNYADLSDYSISGVRHAAQQINPALFPAAVGGISKSDATGWSATKVMFRADKDGPNDGRPLFVQFRRTGDPNDGPTGHVLAEAAINKNVLNNQQWNGQPFSAAAQGLGFHRKYAIVWSANSGGNVAKLKYNDLAASGVLASDDGGASWQFNPTRQVYYELWGTYTAPGPTYNVTRNYVSHVQLLLRSGDKAHSRIDGSVPLLNAPELLSAYWRADFDRDPTAIDVDGNGVTDWAMAGGGSFDPDALEEGVWLASGALETRPQNNFTQTTTIDVRCRNTSPGGDGAVVRVNANRQGGAHAPILVRLQRQTDGTQTLTLLGKPSEAARTTLAVRQRLSPDFVRVRLTVVPEHGLVNLHINDEDQGAFTYPPPYSPPPGSNERFVTVYSDGSNAEFDYVDVRVAPN